MKRFLLLTVTVLAALVVAFVADQRAAGGKPAPAATRDLTDTEVRRTMDRLFRAQVRSSLAWTDSLAPVCEGEPMYHLMRARLYRELVPVDDEQKHDVKRLAQPLHHELDLAIAACDERIAAGDPDPDLRLYRGWARMLSSHMHTFEKSFWSAGRDAKKGKEDLEWYLAQQPRDPVATSLMGAFLYFADTLPAAYKFVSKLLFLPSGDRDRGLRMMELARGWNSLMETDNALILYSVYLGFEGRFEEGLEGFDHLQREFPRHATFVRPEAIMYALLPGHRSAYGDSLDAKLARLEALPDKEIDKSTLALIRFERAYADRFYDPPRAAARFEQIIADRPPHPDWITGFASFELGRLAAARGDTDRARTLWNHVVADESVAYMRDEANTMLRELEVKAPNSGPGPRDVPAVYGADEEARRAVIQSLEAVENPTVADMFYLGEAYLMSKQPDKALSAFTGVINPKAARWDESYQMIACTRAGEILGSMGRYEAAAKHYDRAGHFWHKEFLYDWVLGARQRYFERLKSGDETTPPTLLTTAR